MLNLEKVPSLLQGNDNAKLYQGIIILEKPEYSISIPFNRQHTGPHEHPIIFSKSFHMFHSLSDYLHEHGYNIHRAKLYEVPIDSEHMYFISDNRTIYENPHAFVAILFLSVDHEVYPLSTMELHVEPDGENASRVYIAYPESWDDITEPIGLHDGRSPFFNPSNLKDPHELSEDDTRYKEQSILARLRGEIE
ncbi:hypothetical protein D3C77_570150 [compost metagenome]